MSEPPADRMDPVLNLLNQRPSEDWPWTFEPEAVGHSAVNAVALANLSLLTYSDQAGVRHFLKKWDFDDFAFLRGFNTQGFVARKEGSLFLAFRGTEPVNADDWLSDVNYHQRPLKPFVAGRQNPTVPGLVHGGFGSALEETLTMQPMTMLAAVESIGTEDSRIFVTGHSLGGALAILAAAVLRFEAERTINAVYTYGQPRVGDAAFSNAYNDALGSITFRYVNDLDIVPHLPPAEVPRVLEAPTSLLGALGELRNVFVPERFAHVGQLMLLVDGGSTSNDDLWQAREVTYSRPLGGLFHDLPMLIRAKFGQLLREANRIADHDPLNGYLQKLEALVR